MKGLSEMGEVLYHWGPSIATMVMFILATIFVLKYKLPWLMAKVKKLEKVSHKQDISKVDLMDTVKKNEIYQSDGKPVYQHASNCKDMQEVCQHRICNKVEEVKTSVVNLTGTVSQMGTNMAVLATRVEDMMDKDRTKELESFAKIIIKEMSAKK